MNKVKPVIEFAMQNLIKDDQLETYKESINPLEALVYEGHERIR